jgi:hypothetical protein
MEISGAGSYPFIGNVKKPGGSNGNDRDARGAEYNGASQAQLPQSKHPANEPARLRGNQRSASSQELAYKRVAGMAPADSAFEGKRIHREQPHYAPDNTAHVARHALEQYLSTEYTEEREQFTQALGIDLYA